MSLEHATDSARSLQWRRLVETSGIDVRSQAYNGDRAWFETSAALQDPFFVADARRSCGARYGRAITGHCWHTLSYVVQATQGTGTIVYARAALRDRDSEPVADAENDAACEPYIGCLAQAKLDARIPLPAEMDGVELVIHEHIQSTWGDPTVFALEKLPKLIELTTAERNHLIEKDSRGELTEIGDALRLRFFTSLVPYYHQHMKRMQEVDDEG